MSKIQWIRTPGTRQSKGTDGLGLIARYEIHGITGKLVKLEFNFYPEPDVDVADGPISEMCEEIADVIHKYLDR